jgi:xylan 1,4-beta-xylosidase
MSAIPDGVQQDAFSAEIAIPATGRIELRVEVDHERLYFGFRLEGQAWRFLPQSFDASALSDEATTPGAPNFTGAFVGMACQDMSGTGRPADFDWFEYQEREYEEDPRSRA